MDPDPKLFYDRPTFFSSYIAQSLSELQRLQEEFMIQQCSFFHFGNVCYNNILHFPMIYTDSKRPVFEQLSFRFCISLLSDQDSFESESQESLDYYSDSDYSDYECKFSDPNDPVLMSSLSSEPSEPKLPKLKEVSGPLLDLILRSKPKKSKDCKYYFCQNKFYDLTSSKKRNYCVDHECSVRGCFQRAFLSPNRCVMNHYDRPSQQEEALRGQSKRFKRCGISKTSDECKCKNILLCYEHYCDDKKK